MARAYPSASRDRVMPRPMPRFPPVTSAVGTDRSFWAGGRGVWVGEVRLGAGPDFVRVALGLPGFIWLARSVRAGPGLAGLAPVWLGWPRSGWAGPGLAGLAFSGLAWVCPGLARDHSRADAACSLWPPARTRARSSVSRMPYSRPVGKRFPTSEAPAVGQGTLSAGWRSDPAVPDRRRTSRPSPPPGPPESRAAPAGGHRASGAGPGPLRSAPGDR